MSAGYNFRPGSYKMDLPQEILIHIFKYLSESDQRAASETCTGWYHAANCHLMKKVVKFDRIPLNTANSCPLQIFTNSTTRYSKYLFRKVKITRETLYFWRVAGVNITCLTMVDCDITEDMLLNIFESCPNIEELNICNFSNLPYNLCADMISLDKLKVLRDVSNTRLVFKLLFNYLKTPALEKLHTLNPVPWEYIMQENHGIFACPRKTEGFEGALLGFDDTLVFINLSAKSLKTLLLSNRYMTTKNLEEVLQVKELQLQCLEVYFVNLIEPVAVQALSNHQTSLKELKLRDCQLADEGLAQICTVLVNLECLNIQENSKVTDVGIIHLKKLKLLKSLNISLSSSITKYGLMHGICSQFNETLKELDVSHTNICEDGIILLSESLSLRFLDVSSCTGINDTSIKSIFKNQVHLHTLKMSCVDVSDKGLMEPFCSLGNMKCLRELDISDCRKITDVTFSAFNFKDLCELDISLSNVTLSGLQALVQGCPNIEHLYLGRCPNLKMKKRVREILKKKLSRLKDSL